MTASPFTYTNQDNVPEVLYVSGGAVTTISKNGSTVFNTTNVAVHLDQGDSMIVTYTGLPNILKDRR